MALAAVTAIYSWQYDQYLAYVTWPAILRHGNKRGRYPYCGVVMANDDAGSGICEGAAAGGAAA